MNDVGVYQLFLKICLPFSPQSLFSNFLRALTVTKLFQCCIMNVLSLFLPCHYCVESGSRLNLMQARFNKCKYWGEYGEEIWILRPLSPSWHMLLHSGEKVSSFLLEVSSSIVWKGALCRLLVKIDVTCANSQPINQCFDLQRCIMLL